MTTPLEGGEWSAARPGRTLSPGKTRYPLYRSLHSMYFLHVIAVLFITVRNQNCALPSHYVTRSRNGDTKLPMSRNVSKGVSLTAHCVIAQKSAVLFYLAAEAWSHAVPVHYVLCVFVLKIFNSTGLSKLKDIYRYQLQIFGVEKIYQRYL
jgi:hypothetical protein